MPGSSPFDRTPTGLSSRELRAIESEYLAPGTQSISQLAGIAVDSGSSTTATQFFDRRSTLSLSSDKAGELRLGRDYVPTYSVWVRHDPFSHVTSHAMQAQQHHARYGAAKLAEAGNKYVAEGVAMIEKYPEVAHYG